MIQTFSKDIYQRLLTIVWPSVSESWIISSLYKSQDIFWMKNDPWYEGEEGCDEDEDHEEEEEAVLSMIWWYFLRAHTCMMWLYWDRCSSSVRIHSRKWWNSSSPDCVIKISTACEEHQASSSLPQTSHCDHQQRYDAITASTPSRFVSVMPIYPPWFGF